LDFVKAIALTAKIMARMPESFFTIEIFLNDRLLVFPGLSA
jgi:hypothetical protein